MSQPQRSEPKGLARRMVLPGAVLAALAAEYLVGPLLPDELYCELGAGRWLSEPAQIKPAGWRATGGCQAYDPRCVTEWRVVPAVKICLHGTLWDAVRQR